MRRSERLQLLFDVILGLIAGGIVFGLFLVSAYLMLF